MTKPTIELALNAVPKTETVFDVGSLMAHLGTLIDPRKARGIRYSFVHLLAFLVLAKLGGEDGMKGISEWVKLRGQGLVNLLGLERETMPHQTTYERLLDKLDIEAFERVLGDFFAQDRPDKITITIDGKVLRGTIPSGQTQGVHLLAAYVPEEGVVLMQVEVERKANEIVAAPTLLAALDLRDCVVTGDAMFTQRDLCEQIILAGGDYVFPVKGNQANLLQSMADVFVPAPVTAGHSRHLLPETDVETITAGHGRIEYRYLTLSSQLNDYLDWPHVGQVFRLQRVVHHQKTGRITYQVVFGITSLSAQDCSPERLMTLIRQHWHIENRLHYVRDVTFHEDDCRIRETKRQRVLAALNNLVIGLIRRCDFDYVPAARRFFSLNYDQALQLLL